MVNSSNGKDEPVKNEADVTLKMAHDLMAANNITMSELDVNSREQELGILGEWNKGDKAYKIWENSCFFYN